MTKNYKICCLLRKSKRIAPTARSRRDATHDSCEASRFRKKVTTVEKRLCSALHQVHRPQLWEAHGVQGRVRGDAETVGSWYYRRRDLEDLFFSDRFPAISHQNFVKIPAKFLRFL